MIMYLPPIFLTLLFFFTTILAFYNEKPVIGILTQETSWSRKFCNSTRSNCTYIAASYIKAVEASGGRVIPVFANGTTEYYANVVSKVNGILVPGGDSALDVRFGMGRSTYEIFKIAKLINNARDSFPILGVCLGFELILMASINGKYPFADCDSLNSNLPLELIPKMDKKSVLFSKMPENIRNILLTEPVTANHHRFWNPITINKDDNNLTFISTVEAKNYPFVGLQFHPEKNAWEWRENDPHSPSAICSARYFYDWLVNECRRSKHRYTDNSELENELIYNYPTTYVGKLNSVFEQVYFFNE